jgi:hypothetical protein
MLRISGALGTQRTTHTLHHSLPRYQWTACGSRTKLRFRAYGQRWEYFYNASRPHPGYDMDGQPPLDKLRDLGYIGIPAIAIFPLFLLDDINTYLTMACHPENSIDPLAHYIVSVRCFLWRKLYHLFPQQP